MLLSKPRNWTKLPKMLKLQKQHFLATHECLLHHSPEFTSRRAMSEHLECSHMMGLSRQCGTAQD